MTVPWYTITVVKHEVHPRQAKEGDPAPEEVIGCTVLPILAGAILRGVADEIAPRKPVTRGGSEA